MPDFSAVKLSHAPPRHHPAVPPLSAHSAGMPVPPEQAAYYAAVPHWPNYMNDDLSDCTCAAVAHVIQQWSAVRGQPVTPCDTDVLAFYKTVSGYDGSPATDTGVPQLDVLLHWQTHGALGQTLDGFTTLELRNRMELRDAVHWFGAAIVGMALPKSIEHQKKVWTVPPGGPVGDAAPYSLGGHIIAVVGYDPRGLTIVTWGQQIRMTWRFWETYCVEAYAMLSPLWVMPAGAASGFDAATLRADMARLQAVAPPARRIMPKP